MVSETGLISVPMELILVTEIENTLSGKTIVINVRKLKRD